MKSAIILVATLACVAFVHPKSFYDTNFDNLNIKEITENTRLLKAYMDCFLGKGKCTPEGNDVKQLIPEASNSSCAKCSEQQKKIAAAVIKAMMNQLPGDWETLSKQTDPEGKYNKDLENFLNQYAPA